MIFYRLLAFLPKDYQQNINAWAFKRQNIIIVLLGY